MRLLLPSAWLGVASVALVVWAEAVKETKVTQKDREFSAAEITIKPGEKVVFQNDLIQVIQYTPVTENIVMTMPRKATKA